MPSTEDLVKCFAKYNVKIDIYDFEVSTHTVGEAASALNVEEGQIAKSLLIIVGGQPMMFILAGDKKLDQTKLKRQFDVRKVKFADSDTVLKVSGFPVGGVPPLPINEDVPVYLDRSLFRFEKVYPAAGKSNNCFGINVDTLKQVTAGKEIDCIKEDN
ncbi:MAG: YbaK/EbsC family protein [Clostridiales bacterium]|nr:YbaK/EbsC family protein [Clostridiales bacterium]MCF8021229.1 YbaK/EbsC family protein [Clostridiales bacterium]